MCSSDLYAAVPPWRCGQVTRIGCPAYVFTADTAPADPPFRHHHSRLKGCERVLRSGMRKLLGERGYERLSSWIKTRKHVDARSGSRSELSELPYPKTDDLELSGVVYTSIFNPDDGRKNWQDLLTAWTAALADHEEATLVCKLITKRAKSVRKIGRAHV